MARVTRRGAASRDLVDHFVFLAEHASVEVARRFLQAISSTFDELAQMPEIVSARTFQNPRFSDIRIWPVKGFERYLVFYRPQREGIDVIRVLHGSRDIEKLFR